MSLVGRLRSGLLLAQRITTRSHGIKPGAPIKVFKRRGGSYRMGYRCEPPDDPLVEFAIDGVMSFFWFWMFWHFYHSGGTLINRGVNYHEYTHFTDDELGISED
uniref:Uncharacterized protein LOC100179682 n=1 Tax=Phallusia mammillata TaxID=59560 RepID=A0A6F9DHZ3_9ASCI|nr:uncharacterized protein LOC100179682 [Phallusia mammillata]